MIVNDSAPASAAGPAARPAHDVLLEQFAREYLRERRSARRWRWFWRLLCLAALVALAWAQWGARLHLNGAATPHTALIEVRGEIAEDTDANADAIIGALRDAFDDDQARAVILRFNSPGGSPVQAGIVYDEIQRLKSLKHKKVYAVCEEMCASGAYYMAVGADAIYVDKASVVGSIGVLMDGFGFTGLMDKLGVERRLLTAGANKGMLDPYSPLPASQRAYAQAMLDQIHAQFIAVVREGRGKRLHETPTIFSGLFWNGEEAIKLGLADDYGDLDYVAREVVQAPDIVDYTPQENIADRIVKRFGAAMGAGAVKALQATARVH